MTVLANQQVIGTKPIWLYQTGVTTSDQGTIALFALPSGTRVVDAFIDVTTIGESGTHTILANLETIETTAGVIFTQLSLTVLGRIDAGEGSHAAPGGIIVATTDTTVELDITVSVVGTIVTEAVFNVGILVSRENWPLTSIT